MPLTPDAIAEIRRRLAAARHGERGRTVQALAAEFGVSKAGIYRMAAVGGKKKKRLPTKRHYEEWVRLAVTLQHQAPLPVPLDLAIDAAIKSGQLPKAAADMPIGTAYRVAGRLGLQLRKRRTQRMMADWPMQCCQFDGSTSAALIVGEQIADDDWQLKLHRAPMNKAARGYKNKPLADHRLRLVVYGLWDMCTGYRRAVYLARLGEDQFGSAQALVQMCMQTGDPDRPMHGLPDTLMLDQGALFKGRSARDLTDRLGIAIDTGRPYNSERQGGIERGWRTQWMRFERSLYLLPEADQQQLTLKGINARLLEFERRENGMRPSRTQVAGKPASRTDAWAALVRRRPQPLRLMPENAFETLHREDKRRVDRNGIVRWEGREFECREWHDCWVTARQGLADENLLILEDADGNRAEARPWQRRPFSDIRGIPTTPLDKLLAEAGTMSAVDPYTPAETASNVVSLRQPATPAPTMASPLDASCYGNMAEAVASFRSLFPYPLSPDDLEVIQGHIAEAGLDRRAVADLASTLLAQLSSQEIEK